MADNGMSAILKTLFVGSEWDSCDLSQLQKNRIGYIVRVGEAPQTTSTAYPAPAHSAVYHLVPARDRADFDMRPCFSDANNFIHGARLRGEVVLVHCFVGISRSVTLTVAYLMSVTDYELDDVLRVVKKAREVAKPNPGFLRQLKDFEINGLQAERRRIREKFALAENEDRLGDNAAMKSVLAAMAGG